MRLLASSSGLHLLWWFQRGCCQRHTSWLQGKNKEVSYERIKSCIYNVSSFTHCKGISFLSTAVPYQAFANRLQDWVHEIGLSLGETTHEFCTFHLQESLVNWSPIMEGSAILQTGHIPQTLPCLASYENKTFKFTSHPEPLVLFVSASTAYTGAEMPTDFLAEYDNLPLPWRGECVEWVLLVPCSNA